MSGSRDSLLRAFAGFLLGVLVFGLLALGGTVAIHAAFSADRLLVPNGFAPTPLFGALQLIVALAAGLLGGWVCRYAGRTRKPVLALTAVIFILFFFPTLIDLSVPRAGPVARTGAESAETFRGLVQAHQPAWLAIALPIVIVVGLLLGGSRRLKV